MRVAILHNEVSSEASPAERDVLVQVEAVGQSLARLGHTTTAVPVTLDLASLIHRLEQWRPEVAFNLVESFGGSDRLSFIPPAVLEVMGIRYTGSPAEALQFSGDKLAAKARLAEAGLPTPAWFTADEGNGNGAHFPDVHRQEGKAVSSSRRYGGSRATLADVLPAAKQGSVSLPRTNGGGRFIIKPMWEHASLGMDDESVVTVGEPAELVQKLADCVRRNSRPSFAERFIEGREFNLSLLTAPNGRKKGLQVLPPAEIDFSSFPAGSPRIVGYSAKWNESSFGYNNTPRKFEFAPSDESLLAELRVLAKACWRLFGLRGYARVDFRVDADGRPWILEINANPCLSPDAGFAAALRQASIDFDEAVKRILEDVIGGTKPIESTP